MNTSRQKRGDPWFDDGNIILVTGSNDEAIAFRVHRSVLSRHSEVFQSMFEVAKPPPDSEHVDQCPVVHMPDLPNELSILIKALYDGVGFPIQNRSIHDFYYVTAILRLSTKYCIGHLRAEAVRYLTRTWSYTLHGHDTMLELALKAAAVDGLSYPFVHPLHVLHLARLTDVRIIIPSALYFLSLYPLSDLLAGNHPKLQVDNPSRLSSELTAEDLRDYTLMYQYRITGIMNFVRRLCVQHIPAVGCSGGRDCMKAFATLGARLSSDWVPRTGPLHFMVQAMDELANYSNACASCRKAFRQDVTAARELFWKEMPTTVGLPPWEELEQDLNLPPLPNISAPTF
ncbi:hypothetical protein NM688_g1359 [Phlebia brevispora]|uniref:Uncharacterized protein n=1 Tax=Phlebia brevispora TaxID=194682 RepID=A0ACC1TBR6_9APHY|nr:hypothetical protein NM688_g1359 [Phlebia brevispora]